MLKIGLTGGIASGKSTVSQLFHERHGIPVVDADVVAREVVTPGQSALAQIVGEFGESVLDSHGELDRQHIRDLIFSNDEQRHKLEAILHPVIEREMLRQVSELKAPYCILAIPLLVEANQTNIVDRVLVIDTPEKVQIERLTRRDNIPLTQANKILSAQIDRETRLAVADDIITNTGPIEDLTEQVDRLHAKYQRLSDSL